MRRDIARLARFQGFAFPLGIGALFIAYAALAEANYRFVFPPGTNALFWLPSGLSLALLLRTAPTRWPGWLSAIFLAETMVVLHHGPPLRVAVAWGLAGGLMPLSGALLLRRFAAPTPFMFRRIKDVVLFVGLGAMTASLPGALVAAAAGVAWLGMPSFLEMATSWWGSDVLGVVLLGPPILAWTTRTPNPPGRTVEALVLLAAGTGIGWWIFHGEASGLKASLPYLLIPITTWAAVRFGIRGATLATLVLDVLAVWQTMKGRGPFAVLSVSMPARLLDVQVYIAVVGIFALAMATVAAQMREALAAAEEAERRTAFLAGVTTLLSESLDHAEILARLARLCVPWLADWCLIDIVEQGTIRRVGGAHTDPAKEYLLRELQAHYAVDWSSPQPSVAVLRSGQALLLPEMSDEIRRSYCTDEQSERLIRELGTQTTMAVPLVIRGETIGAITLVSAAPGRRYGPADLALAEEVARRASVAVDNARLFRDAQEAIGSRDEFLSIASHELHTPITALLLTVQGLQRRSAASSDALLRSLARIERQVLKVAHLAGELLSVSRVMAGKLELQIEDVDLTAVVQDVAERFAEELSQEGYTLSVRVDGPVVGRWDPVRLEQVVSNLLSNAIKFGAGKPIEVALRTAAGTARLVVTDQGIGMPAGRIPYIFDRFERAVSARSYGGLGLGLYIVRTIVEALGGSVRAESELGKGSSFIVELPCAGPPAPDAGPSAPP